MASIPFSKLTFLGLIALMLAGTTSAQLIINEGSNKNFPTLLDEDGDYEDWIEIYNAGNTALDLFNYSLSDNATPREWVFPHQLIQPNQFIVVFCSGKNRYATSAFTQVVSDSAFQPQAGWNTHRFSTPFYWDGTSNVVVNMCFFNGFYSANTIHFQTATSYKSTIYGAVDGSSVCNVEGGSTAMQRPNLRLNGAVIGTGNIQNSPYDYPAPYGNWFWSARHQFLIPANELIAAGLAPGNIDSLAFQVSSSHPVTYSSIDLSMAGTGYGELTGPFLMNNGNLNHTNFKISSSGETIRLYSPSNALVSSLNVNCGQGVGVSIGSFPDATTNVKKFADPSPGATNNLSLPAVDYAVAPRFSANGGIFTSPLAVTITDPNSPNARVYYTLDGNDPDTTSLLWNGNPIFMFQTTILRARAYVNGKIPSSITSSSYLFNTNHTTPIISVVTDSQNLFGPTGMFDNPTLDLLKAASIEYFDSTSSHNLWHAGRAGIMMDGGWAARSKPQRAFRINFDHSVLGDGPILRNVIPDRPRRNKFSDFYLRNGSNNFLRLPYKDAAQVKMMGDGSYNYYTAWRPVTVYINGAYWGLYELREKTNTEMFQLAENANPNTVKILSSTSQYGFRLRAIEGSVQSFYTAYDSFLQVNPADSTFWDQADLFFDMKYYNDYIIAEIWMDNVDWAFHYNNLKLYRSNTTNYRWRYILTDLEYGLLPNDEPSLYNCNQNFLAQLMGADPNNPHLNIWLRGMQNHRFRDYFINRFADQMNSLYLPSRLLAIDNYMFNQTVVEMANEFRRWGDPANVPAQLNNFYQNHLLFQSELLCRPTQMRSHIERELQLPQQVEVTLDVYPPNAGFINISTISPDVYPWNGVYFDGVPVGVEAQALPGYQFSHWESNVLIADTLNSVFLDTLHASSVTFKAYFELTTGLGEVSPSLFSVFPNPSLDNISIKHSSSSETLEELTFVDLLGRKTSLPFSMSGNNEYQIDVSSLTKGYYVICYISEGKKLYKAPFVKL